MLGWIKAHLVWILGAISVALAAWIAWGSYQRRVETLRDSLESERSLSRVRVLEAQRDAAMERDAEFAQMDKFLHTRIADAQRAAVEVIEDVENRTDAEIASRFNELYR